MTDNRPSASRESFGSGSGDPLALTVPISELLLVVFIHGFKGTDETFGNFPERLQHVLSETISHVTVECIVFPAYETKGELTEAVVRFADWLTTLTIEREVASGGGAGKAKIVLCGHSMGGILAADTLLEFAKSLPDKQAPLWPKIIACVAFDTPYLGLHPYVFKNSATKAAEYANTARTVGSAVFGSIAGFGAKKASGTTTPLNAQTSGSSWSKWAPAAYAVGGALVAGAAVGGAYYKREDLGLGYTWATDHMKYVRNLWDEDALKRRVETLLDVEKDMGVVFRTFYAFLPPTPPAHFASRTFIVLPPQSSPSFSHFLPTKNGLALDELQAHTGMFGGKTNDGYYELGLETARIIRESVMLARGIVEDAQKEKGGIPVVSPGGSINKTPGTPGSTEKKASEELVDI